MLSVFKIVKKNKALFSIVAIGLLFIVVYASYYHGNENIFSSPDESANYYFIRLFSEKTELSYGSELNKEVDGIIRPRSMAYADGKNVPQSFTGMPILYGLISKAFGVGVIPYLTPIFTVIGIVFYYLLIKRIFGKNIAYISAALLYVVTPVWYYSARGMFHNMFFISLLIISFFLLFKVISHQGNNKKQSWIMLLAGVLFGFALFVRTSEVVWTVVLFLVPMIAFRKKILWRHVFIFIAPILLIGFIIAFINNHLYGSPFSFAYTQSAGDNAQSGTATQIERWFTKIKGLLFPFGLQWELIWSSTKKYLFAILPWYSILFFIGLIAVLKSIAFYIGKIFTIKTPNDSNITKTQKIYIITFLFIAIWLIIYYGSFEFYEYIDKDEILLGSSYLRYWLPIFVFGMPFVSYALIYIKNICKGRIIRNVIPAILILFFIYGSVQIIIADPLQGFGIIKSNKNTTLERKHTVEELTEQSAVIIAGQYDKELFPDRQVIVSLPNNKIDTTITTITNNTELYFYHNALDIYNKKLLDTLIKLKYNIEIIYEFEGQPVILYKISRLETL